MENDKICTLIINGDKKAQPSAMDLQKKIEAASSTYMQRKDAKKLVEALEELLLVMVNGNSYPRLLMTIIRFVITCDDHRVKQLLGLYWELCDKVKETGEIKEEMVLVCNAIRNDLIHANEFIRGRTLRLLCRMRYFKILEPLIESILKNLSHRNAYVRRNAVACVYSIVKSFGPDVIPQASVEIEQLLLVEGDLSTKRIAFIMLVDCDIDRAIHYAVSVEEQVTSLGDVFQLAILELVRRVSKIKPTQKAKLIKSVFYLATGTSPAVMFECAEILCRFSNTPTAVQIATGCYVGLLNSQPDNNVKLIVLEKLFEISKSETNRHIVESMIMDILRGLSCPAIGVRNRIIDLASCLLTRRNIVDAVTLFKKELTKACSPENLGSEGNLEYRKRLVVTLQQACAQHADQAELIVPFMVQFLEFSDMATDVINFLREVLCTNSKLRESVCSSLVQMLGHIKRSQVARVSLWLLGEFVSDRVVALDYLNSVLLLLGQLPLSPPAGEVVVKDVDVDKLKTVNSADTATGSSSSSGGDSSPGAAVSGGTITTKTVVLADGTYGSQAVYVSSSASKTGAGSDSFLRTMIRNGDILLASLVGVVLAKLYLKSIIGDSISKESVLIKNRVLLATASLAKIVKHYISFGYEREYLGRLVMCIRVVSGGDQASSRALFNICVNEWLSEKCRESLTKLVQAEGRLTGKNTHARILKDTVAANKPVQFRILKDKRDALVVSDPTLINQADHEDSIAESGGKKSDSILSVVGSIGVESSSENAGVFTQRLEKAGPMTGLADPVYIEGFLRLTGYDLLLELLLVNRTKDTLQNLLVELYSQGGEDMVIVNKPEPVTLGPGESTKVFATIKVTSTENGVIFGYASFDKKSALDKEWLVLNEVHADILDFMKKDSVVTESDFKSKWQEFEWENKISIDSNIANVNEFVTTLMNRTNLGFVGTMDQVGLAKQLLNSGSKFFALNLYTKSIFGEDALANVCLEKTDSGLTGAVRIRSRTQGIALGLGDRVSQIQKDRKMRGG